MRTILRRCNCLLAALSALMAIPLTSLAGVDRDRIQDADFTKTVTIVFSGTSATVTDKDNAGVTVTRGDTDSAVAIKSTAANVEYILSGNSSSGYFQLTSTYRSKILLNGVTLGAPDGPALSVLGSAETYLVLAKGTTNTLADSASYSRTGKGTIYTGGAMFVSGKGSLNLSSSGGHGIFTTGNLRIFDGKITVTGAAKDAIHPKTTFEIDGGELVLTATEDGIDAASGIIQNGGRITFNSAEADVKGVKSDATIDINGGTLAETLSGDQSKGISAGGDVTITGGALFMNLSGNVVLESATTDAGAAYTDPSYCTGIKSDGSLTVTGGHVAITHTGTAGKGISVDGAATFAGGAFDISIAGSTSASYTNEDGETDSATPGAIKADGNVTISDGSFTLALDGASANGISTDGDLAVSGGTFAVKATGNQTKGFKSDGAITLSGGTGTFKMSGGVVLEQSGSYYDPSYCTAIKADGNLTVTGGSFTITHSGTAGKGVSVDGNIVMTGGSFVISTSGGVSSSYTNTDGELDMASADGFKCDGDLSITGGTLTVASTGTGGDAISCDGNAVIGVTGVEATPVITASTSGLHVLLSGSGENADYVNAKAFKAGGNLTMNGGVYTGTTSTDGGEGMESKANLTINGGTIEINSYDDAINAATNITINGGNIYCYSSGNDGIDSNGTLTITGGTVVSSGTSAPEEGFDCDNNTFTITGGTIVGTGGSTSTPTSSACKQYSVIYSGTGTANVVLQIKSSSGNALVYKLPRSYSGSSTGGPGGSSGSMTLLFSSADLKASTTYTIVSGATISGGTEFHGLYTDATLSGGTTLKTFTTSSLVTSVQ